MEPQPLLRSLTPLLREIAEKRPFVFGLFGVNNT
jgi:hypothetical protein